MRLSIKRYLQLPVHKLRKERRYEKLYQNFGGSCSLVLNAIVCAIFQRHPKWAMVRVSLPLNPAPDTLVYLVFDGNGNIIDCDMFYQVSFEGNYSVNSSGVISGTLKLDTSSFQMSGQLVSQTFATGSNLLSRVTNPGALTDSLVGTLSTGGYGQRSITLRLNSEGQIVSATGLVGPVSGRVYADSGVFAGHLKTGEADPWDEFSIAGYYSNDSLNGGVALDVGTMDVSGTGPAHLVRKGTVTGVISHTPTNPTVFALSQNYPNPFNPSTVISYQLPANSLAVLKVFDVLGREVGTLVNERQSAGSHSITFNAATLPSGVYFYRLEAGTYHDTKKLLLLK